MEKILILDTTMREGEQAPNVSFSHEQRLALGRALSDFGADFIEISPIVSEEQKQTTKELAKLGLASEVVAQVRASRKDIDVVLETDARWTALFLSTSDIHIKDKLKTTRESVLEKITDAITYAKSHGLKLRFTCEDASRSDFDFLLKVCRTAEAAGADRLSIPDTVGVMTPRKMYELISAIRKEVRTPLDMHCHNDLGLALANSLAGIEAGATCVHASINGAGERCGITPLAEIVMALKVLECAELRVKTEMLCELSRMFSSFTGVITNPFSPVVGENAFKHKGGTHLAAVLQNNTSYEAFSPESVGNRRALVLGEYSGKNMMRFISEALGMDASEERLARAVKKLKTKGRDLFEFEM